jgi:lipoprotein NlpD
MPPPASPSTFRMRASVCTRIVAALLLLCLAACASKVRAPVEDRSPRASAPVAAPSPQPAPAREPGGRPQTYTVKRGDTLYGIALDNGLDYRELAAWNNIENVNLIRAGQVLRVVAPDDGASAPTGAAGVQTMPLRAVAPVQAGDTSSPVPAPPPAAPLAAASGTRNTDTYKSQPKAVKEPYSEQALRDVQRAGETATIVAAAPPPQAQPPVAIAPAETRTEPKNPINAADDGESLDWVWPAKGKIVAGFSEATNLKGIDIAGTAGQPVSASAAGKVVYAGTGLRGYGKLIIIKHNGTYLSAYAHNREILVKEGQQVTKGQKIAEMGNTDADQVKLHFEIRRQGKPVDPQKYLPPA